ncbi:MAG TPA: hypothetical protein DCQ26_12740 [Marinilabiliales bacterium]|nr:MAG: hypothetical protein A2W95_08775 [Bacteroidetes bacterium GWA2_40_14]OFX75987.1 MAG: hypothetical protein A2W96_00855 [Bacteroidetes bacterium GWD2_40_43]OFX94399.1 MAG: hypothetical protein A2W97_19765 [Bacteroidetes bacterium GWE2_40_63]OFY18877.1 MAG: hypothetical protein A2W88_06535 [Bacteroidetes bacterium GWF2_40_13]OFZ28898.1 MAG: hypothetical protein A2437_13410 [Bacteroidetes bacterium RIFOXYC2_FULL_40_12]HAM99467.1 hypothetical protein [Marinilabiliales bacterium]
MVKNILFAGITLFVLAFTACDTIEGPYKETPVVEPAGDTIPAVVLFEFTGWNCPFCYLGHEAVQQLEEAYSERVQAIAIHAGSFAEPGNEGPDFRCMESDQLLEKFNRPSEFPTGAINSINEDDLTGPTEWGTVVAEQIALSSQSPEVFITTDSSHTSDELTVSFKVKFADDLSGTYNFCAYVVENGIIAPQNKAGEGIIEEYEHQHVLRASMKNGIMGETLATNPTSGTVFEKSYTLLVDITAWNIDSLKVIPFVYNTETYELLRMNFINPKTE